MEHMSIGTKEGVAKAWAVKRRPEGERWDIGFINGVVGKPGRAKGAYQKE